MHFLISFREALGGGAILHPYCLFIKHSFQTHTFPSHRRLVMPNVKVIQKIFHLNTQALKKKSRIILKHISCQTKHYDCPIQNDLMRKFGTFCLIQECALGHDKSAETQN